MDGLAGWADFLGQTNPYANRIQISKDLGEAGTLVKRLKGMQWSKDPSKMMFMSI